MNLQTRNKRTNGFEICWGMDIEKNSNEFFIFHIHYDKLDKYRKNPIYRICEPVENNFICRMCKKVVPKGIVFTAATEKLT